MSATEQDVKSAMAKPDQPANNPWPARLESFKKFSEKFHERGSKIEQRYEDDRESEMYSAGTKRVNMFYSNVTVIKESLYNSLPKPVVSRLHTGEWDNDAARVAALIVERGLSYEVKCAPSFDAAVKSAILDRLVPGMGTLWVNFNAATQEAPEHITVDIVYWKDLVYEPQRSWELVTWVGRKLHVDKEVAKQRWGEAAVTETKSGGNSVESAIASTKTCVIQMWDKNTKTVVHMTPTGTVLDTVEDPYQLKTFFPTPKPLIACPPTRQFLPMTDYYMAQDQYNELDILYARINLIIEAIKVAGVYDSSVTEVPRMLSGSENKLIPVDNWAMYAEKGGAKGVIDWFPVEAIATVLAHLVSTYEFIKTQLFEVTGMADIIRGSSNQYETAAAQQIKAQFASVRMNGSQRDIAVFVRDTLRIMTEIMCQLYSDQKFEQIVGKLPEADQPFIQGAAQILRNDYTLYYNVDIQSDSLTQADWGLQQEQRMAYAQSLSQFLTSALPVAESNPTLAPLLVQVIKFISVGFKGSAELEGTLDSVLDQLQQDSQEPEEPPPPSPEEQKAQIEMQSMQAKQQLDQQNAAIKQQVDLQNAALKRQVMEAEFAHKERMNQQELQFQREKHAMDMEFEKQKFEQEQAREGFRTAADIANSAAKSNAKLNNEG